jgi:hypothetical protein
VRFNTTLLSCSGPGSNTDSSLAVASASASSESSGSSAPVGAIVGGVVAGFVVGCLVAAGAVYALRKRRHDRYHPWEGPASGGPVLPTTSDSYPSKPGSAPSAFAAVPAAGAATADSTPGQPVALRGVSLAAPLLTASSSLKAASGRLEMTPGTNIDGLAQADGQATLAAALPPVPKGQP